MRWHTKSTRTVAVESYVTVRGEWLDTLARMVPLDYNARGHRVVGGRMEWQYFYDEAEARKWAEEVHLPDAQTQLPEEPSAGK